MKMYNKPEVDAAVAKMYPQSRLPGMMFSSYVEQYLKEQYLKAIYPEKPKPFFEEIAITEYPGRYHVRIVKTYAVYEDGGNVIVTFCDGYVQRYDAATHELLSNSAPWQVQNCLV